MVKIRKLSNEVLSTFFLRTNGTGVTQLVGASSIELIFACHYYLCTYKYRFVQSTSCYMHPLQQCTGKHEGDPFHCGTWEIKSTYSYIQYIFIAVYICLFAHPLFWSQVISQICPVLCRLETKIAVEGKNNHIVSKESSIYFTVNMK